MGLNTKCPVHGNLHPDFLCPDKHTNGAINIKEVEQVFFMAMREGWAAGAEKISMPGMPGYKAIRFQYREWHVLDKYCANSQTGKSAGETTIWYERTPVWVMQYGGAYDKRVISFLKKCLMEYYEKSIFWGGRGMRFSNNSSGSLFYTNDPLSNNFSQFEGHEEVITVDTGECMGYHDYKGMSLVQAPQN